MKRSFPLVCAALVAASSSYALDPHVEAVLRIVEAAKGKVEKTADGQSLKLVDLAVPGSGPHDHRKEDPYNAAFFEHLGHITTLESLHIISTKFNDEWMPPLAKLTSLRSLRFVNNGKLSDAGLEHLAGLRNLTNFAYVGTAMKGHAFAKFTGWTQLSRCSFRGSSIDDEGLKNICERFPKLESLVLAHAKFTDASAPHLAKLTQLKGLELGTHNATSASLRHVAGLPLEYLQLGEGFDSPASLPYLKPLKTLKRLTITSCKAMADDDLRRIAALKQVENLELGGLALPEARLALLKDFAHLKALRVTPSSREKFSPELQAAVKRLLPNAALKFE
ncbi:MAG: G protein-coupled receptor LGR4 [Limisphaerales bacterium]|nr:MAG: G protein-coupled receptor LGR4 [Limisphaerales bacterium]KAG0510102.1 MAG: G protein-coupled receptor LGR4 [Limisphaerales bacterium]TXT52945.1 MAG: G protein-coupled receptor LGR4 [Limisphaerales bacterium]